MARTVAADVSSRSGGDDRLWRLRLELPSAAVDAGLELLAAVGSVGTWQRPAGGEGALSRPEGEAEVGVEGTLDGADLVLVDAWFESQYPSTGLCSRLEGLGARDLGWAPAENRDWLEEYRRAAQPIRVGRFELDPREPDVAGQNAEADSDADRLLLPARSAFGTGSHETTRLVVELLQELEVGGRSVLDVGAGSGVLSFVARRLGAARVLGFDLDPMAALLAGQNARINRLPTSLFAGLIDSVAPTARFEIVLVNVLPENLAGAEEQIASRVADDGDLVLSGILTERAPEIEDRWRWLGMEAVDARTMGEWTLLRLRRKR